MYFLLTKKTQPYEKSFNLSFCTFAYEFGFCQPPCSTQYSFTYTGDSTTCQYTFTPTNTTGVCNITWSVESYGYYGVACDPETYVGNPLTYTFCFVGYYKVKMCLEFCRGGSCCVTQTIWVNCIDLDVCNPDPERIEGITTPKVDITYISADTCNFSRSQPVQGCMYSNIPGQTDYYISCGWKWALRVHPTNCSFWQYFVRYDSIVSCGNYTCVTRALDTNITCINAYIDRPIYVYATTVHCCIPTGTMRGYYWTPTPASGSPYTPIGDPTPTVSLYCSAYRNCPDYTYCIENPQYMTETTPPAYCFKGGGGQTYQRLSLKKDEQLSKEQQVIIYTIQGTEVFKGKWKFNNGMNPELNWPGKFTPGIYLVKFGETRELIKLYKVN